MALSGTDGQAASLHRAAESDIASKTNPCAPLHPGLTSFSPQAGRSEEQTLEIRFYLRDPPFPRAEILARWQEAIASLQMPQPLRLLTATLDERQASVRLTMHADGWEDPEGGVVPLAMAKLLAHLRYGEARTLAIRIGDTRQLATLARPSRGPLRALARESGALCVLLKGRAAALPSAGQRDGWATVSTCSTLEDQQPRLVIVGPPPVLRRAKGLVRVWLFAEGHSSQASVL